jgi:phosphonoacetate hydrolase
VRARALATAALLLLLGGRAWGERPRVVVVVVDGLAARAVTASGMPYLTRAWREATWCTGVHARTPMPARTNVSFATLVTGVQPEIHGILGNAFWDRAGKPRKLGAAQDLLTETLFTVAAQGAAGVHAAVAVGKAKLQLMFAATSVQEPPAAVWDPDEAEAGDRDPGTGYAYDRATLAGARRLLERGDLDVMLIDLADVDRVSHVSGPDSQAASDARRESDRAIGAFIDALRADATWPRTTVIVTADHGFATVERPVIRFGDLLRAARLDALVSVADGPIGHVYARQPGAAGAGDLLAAVRALALRTTGVAEALYLRPNDADGGTAHVLGRVHPEWHVSHPRGGDLVVVTSVGFMLSDGTPTDLRLRGTHGGPNERDVPLIVVQGEASQTAPVCEGITLADVGRTVAACLGLRETRRLDGAPIPEEDRGRVLAGLCRGYVLTRS